MNTAASDLRNWKELRWSKLWRSPSLFVLNWKILNRLFWFSCIETIFHFRNILLSILWLQEYGGYFEFRVLFLIAPRSLVSRFVTPTEEKLKEKEDALSQHYRNVSKFRVGRQERGEAGGLQQYSCDCTCQAMEEEALGLPCDAFPFLQRHSAPFAVSHFPLECWWQTFLLLGAE